MIDIFEIRNGQLSVTDNTLSIASFRKIWESDKTVKKTSAMDAFLFIYHMHHPRSPYAGYSDAERESAVRKHELSGTLRTSKKLEDAINDFVRLRDEADPLFSLFQAAKHALYQIKEYYKTIDVFSDDFDLKKVTDSLNKLGGMIKSYNEIEEQVKDKIYTVTKTRGDREINIFEQ